MAGIVTVTIEIPDTQTDFVAVSGIDYATAIAEALRRHSIGPYRPIEVVVKRAEVKASVDEPVDQMLAAE